MGFSKSAIPQMRRQPQTTQIAKHFTHTELQITAKLARPLLLFRHERHGGNETTVRDQDLNRQQDFETKSHGAFIDKAAPGATGAGEADS